MKPTFIQDANELESDWKEKMSVKSIFRNGHGTELWLNDPNEDPAVDNADLSTLIYAAGRTDVETFKSLLPHTNFNSVATALETKGTDLLHILIEAPLVDVPMTTAEPESTCEDTSTCASKCAGSEKTSSCQLQVAPPLPKEVDKYSSSLSCLQALSNHNNNRFGYF